MSECAAAGFWGHLDVDIAWVLADSIEVVPLMLSLT